MNELTRIEPITAKNNGIYLNLCQPYEAEFAPLTGELPNEKGLYSLQTPVVGNQCQNAWGFLAFIQKTPVGFVVLNNKQDYFDVAEFYIIPSHRKFKLGTHLAHYVFAQYSGKWQIRQIKGADHAVCFWRSAISSYQSTQLQEEEIEDPFWGTVTRQRFVT